MNLLQNWRNKWYYVGGILFVGLAYYMALFGNDLPGAQKIMILSFMGLMVHQFEEYAVPGGFPPMWNIVFNGEKEVPDRYPLNKQSTFFVNIVGAYPMYLIAICFPHWYWYGIIVACFGLVQFIIHGIMFPIKFKSYYNPGVATVITIFIPMALYYFWYIHSYCDVQPWEWWVGILLTPVVSSVVVTLPIKIFKSKTSPFPFTPEEMKRFNVQEKLSRRSNES
jgi:hypothetical protein